MRIYARALHVSVASARHAGNSAKCASKQFSLAAPLRVASPSLQDISLLSANYSHSAPSQVGVTPSAQRSAQNFNRTRVLGCPSCLLRQLRKTAQKLGTSSRALNPFQVPLSYPGESHFFQQLFFLFFWYLWLQDGVVSCSFLESKLWIGSERDRYQLWNFFFSFWYLNLCWNSSFLIFFNSFLRLEL